MAYAGFFEEIRPEDLRAKIETNLFGSVNVTARRAACHVEGGFAAPIPGLVATVTFDS